MILSFKEQFIRPIIRGEKIHTIRLDKNRRWKAGNLIHFSTNVRTSSQYQFHVGKCLNVEDINISRDKRTVNISIINKQTSVVRSSATLIADGIGLLGLLAKNDGLSVHDFIEWFVPKENDFFIGRIIHWTDSSYT